MQEATLKKTHNRTIQGISINISLLYTSLTIYNISYLDLLPSLMFVCNHT